MEPEHATFEVDDRDGVLVIALTGEIDMANADSLENDLRQAVDGRQRAVLDLSGLTFVDSSGCRLLTVLGREAKAAGRDLRAVCPPDSPLRRVMEITSVADDLPILPDLAAARQGLGPQS